MVSTYGVAFLAACFIFFAISLLLDVIIGNTGRFGQIKKHFHKIKGRGKAVVLDEDLKGELDRELMLRYRRVAFMSGIGVFLFSYIVFFGSLSVALFLFSITILLLPRMLKNKNTKKREKLINVQFRDALNAIMSSLKSGLSMNRALAKVPQDLEKIHAIHKEKIILKEFINVRNDLNMGVTVDDALIGLRDRLSCEEGDDFVNSVIILKKKGGNLVEVMENTISMISDKMALKSEIEVLVAAKKMESKVLTGMPILVVVGQSTIMRSYVEPLFIGWGNVLAMIAFLLLLINYFVGEKITDIKA